MTRGPAAGSSNGVAEVVVYQIMNFDREEILYGVTGGKLEDEVLRLARDRKGPTKDWSKDEVVSWRPITGALKPAEARLLHREFESKTPPNKFTVLKTYSEEG